MVLFDARARRKWLHAHRGDHVALRGGLVHVLGPRSRDGFVSVQRRREQNGVDAESSDRARDGAAADVRGALVHQHVLVVDELVETELLLGDSRGERCRIEPDRERHRLVEHDTVRSEVERGAGDRPWVGGEVGGRVRGKEDRLADGAGWKDQSRGAGCE